MKITRRNKDGKEVKPPVELRRRDASEMQKEQAQALEAQLRQAQEAEGQRAAHAAEITTLKARRLELGRDLEAARPALVNAKLFLAQARAKGDGDLDALRAKVVDCRREIEELEGAVDIIDADLARLNPGTQFGKFKVV